MTTRQIHPSELAQLLQTRFTAKGAAIGLVVLSLLLLAGGSRAIVPETKLWLFGGGFGVALLSRSVHHIARDHQELFSDARDISLTNWQNQLFKRTRDDSLTVEAIVANPVPSAPIPLFNWTNLADEDEHPVIAIVAPMGGGKSRLVKFLAKHAMFDTQPNITAFDIYARDADWPTAATDHQTMLNVMTADLAEIYQRIPQYRSGISDFIPQVRVLEEAVDTLPGVRAINKQADTTVTDWLRKHVSVARKLKYRLMLVSVKLGGTDIGIGAESRDDATIIFPGFKGIAKAMSDIRYLKLGTAQNAELRDRLRATLANIPRPALVYHGGDWYPAAVPELTISGDPLGMSPMLSAAPAPNFNPDVLDSIETLCHRLEGKRDNCTPGNVRKYIPSTSNLTDAEIIQHFETLAEQNRCTLDKTGKTPKIKPIPNIVGEVGEVLEAI